MKLGKRWMAFLLAALLCIGAAGCGGKEEEGADTNQTTETENTDLEAQSPSDSEENEKPADADTQTAPASATAYQEAWIQADGSPELTAASGILVERNSGTILFEKDAKAKMYPASMTKIITALVVMDYFQPDELITVGTEINEVSLDSSKAGHVLGETLTVENAIRGLIIPSGNDSANVLAAAVAKRVENDENLNFARCETIFADLMNQKAEELGAVNSHFTNAHGYHDENHYSCAYDMALFANAFMNNETLAEIAAEKGFSGDGANNMFENDPSVTTQEYAWRSHNLLITDNEYQYAYATGIKTGFTDEAGDCLTASAEKDDTSLICVLFQSEDPARWTDATNLFEYGFNNYTKVDLAAQGEAVAEMPLTKQNKLQGDTIPLVFQSTKSVYLPAGTEDQITSEVRINDEYRAEDKDGTVQVKAPVAKGAEVGTILYSVDGKQIGTETLYAGTDVEKGGILNNIHYFLKTLFSHIFSLKGLITIVILIVVIVVIYFILNRLRYGRRRRSGGYTFKNSGRRRRRRFK
ncbi:D-alanyl-D-alanine carboxypeptidase [Anaerotignum lactatifermentans]|uniref:serine-type D-Ala-D-Ala carboxypeptidase n=1 Tax=Anaerotignum lactatifermentans TaxID=160404 RepID=A0ABS2GB34_9FIRM|nr:D-alanyl-D-alanine carboxypeptidase family protein [Anaerotignum lactatifermentans]MBM6828508.1 D-alanyl-D-alanine carboxypeptidase [Anaerotignum lactatifermentans]MBM6877915.1 D-alanyl-D-alanine carboxypeptidase [Anaerotignum lactatifermentans]MBM6950090.1 D-alanyl-D-alanine carboxypeptidase [Anaerotignum lactatifermentans]